MRTRTLDLSTTTPLRFFTVEKLGEKQSLTPEGFLVIEDVPIARTGTMLYGPGEVPVTPGPDGVVRVHRDETEVFRPEYIASYQGKHVVDDHPPEDVAPENWKSYSVGTVLNPRRGTGMQADLLIADFIIYDLHAIEAIRAGKREVSCGYDANYVEIGPGEGKQTDMLGNHVALVETGRCGPRCAIGDKQSIPVKEQIMNKAKAKDSLIVRLIKAFKAKDEAGFTEALGEMADDAGAMGGEGNEPSAGGEGATHVHVHAAGGTNDEALQQHIEKNDAEHKEFRDRLDAIEAAMNAMGNKGGEGKGAPAGEPANDNAEIEGDLREEAPAGTADRAIKARDSAYLEESFQQTIADAEILAPGIRIPTFDRAATPKDSLTGICKFRRTALDSAMRNAEDRIMIEGLNGGVVDLDKMTCGAVRQLFRSSVAAKRAANNARTGDFRGTAAGTPVKGAVKTPADLNKKMAEYYSAH